MAQSFDVPLQSRIVDDKSPICIPFILSRIETYQKQHPNTTRPFIIGLNGVQGVGKTTLVRALAETLQGRDGLPTLVVSIDDFYLTHADQLALAAAHPDNQLVQYRGEPGTHDIPLLASFLTSLTSPFPPEGIHVPQYDKSLFSGLGDRSPPSTWSHITSPPKVVILEGWLVGFRPLSPVALEAKYSSPTSKTLHRHLPAHLMFINSCLEQYQQIWDQFDAFVHGKGVEGGMTDEQVKRFVDCYFPAYELYIDGIRNGVFGERKKACQLRLVVGRDRSVKESLVI
ncbi:P-loop containing nucleoside triphosphate hydrolase protein [Apiosordaria backusii]|uniref:P-loop containing nucleoside triphosphate hydrolase protein n=1 Tax=Apiosordaria backusii TaxID=314023 RepID=A0AA40DSX1_9PEZI|nr:P-loop containing nucleoside triphosphate hydrolase protein [Apiosordaria backusii]